MATLLVTSLLVASPILFLISTAPSQLPKNCNLDQDGCITTDLSPQECTRDVCRAVSSMIQSNINWEVDPCINFKEFSCSMQELKASKSLLSPQETVDFEMQQLLQHNTTFGPFRKLGRLFESCLRQKTNSSTIRFLWEQLGGYLPIGALGPSAISTLISKIHKLGPLPLFDMYFDLSYGRRPHVLLIISGPSLFAPILQNKIRWIGPKAPPYRAQENVSSLYNDLLRNFLPTSLNFHQKLSESESISSFINELNMIRVKYSRLGFWDSSMLFNASLLQDSYPKFNWTSLLPSQWSGPVVVRSSEYLNSVDELLSKYPTRVVHNSLLLHFALGILPRGDPNPVVCTRAVMWALPDITSALYISQHSSSSLNDVAERSEIVFKTLKAYLKRAPSLKGAALVKLSSLKVQSQTWPGFANYTDMLKLLDELGISSHNWFENVLKIFKRDTGFLDAANVKTDLHDAWAYPILAKVFYDNLSHSIVVPLSVLMGPHFDTRLPVYLQYASVGLAIAKEILRSVTKSFEETAMHCVPASVHVLSNHSQMDVLINSGGLQIAYHSMLSLTGPMKGMERLPELNLTPPQIFYLVLSQEFCIESIYEGIDTNSSHYANLVNWLIAQGGSAIDVFNCPTGSTMSSQKTCTAL